MRLGLILCACGVHRDKIEKVFKRDPRQVPVYGDRCQRCKRPRAHIGGARRGDSDLGPGEALNFVEAYAWLRRNKAPIVIHWI